MKLMTIDLLAGPEEPIITTNLIIWQRIKHLVNDVVPFMLFSDEVQFLFKDEVPSA